MNSHLPDPKTWDCDCGEPWPCPPAREALAKVYADDPTALGVYMAVQLEKAAPALFQVTPAELYDRFIAWPLALRTPLDAP